MSPVFLEILADLILIAHVLFVLFVVLGLVIIYLGYFLQWLWVRNRAFRITHLAAIGFVVMQSWFGAICPLTIWEMQLRQLAGLETYSGAFIQYWLHQLIFFTAPEWVFISIYTVFGSLVLFSWFVVKPDSKKSNQQGG